MPYNYLEAKEYAIKSRDVKVAIRNFEFNDEVNVVERDSELRLDKIDLEEIE